MCAPSRRVIINKNKPNKPIPYGRKPATASITLLTEAYQPDSVA